MEQERIPASIPVTRAEAAQALLDFEAAANDLERRFLLALAEDYVAELAKARLTLLPTP